MRQLLDFLSPGRPTFPDALSAGDPVERHLYMLRTLPRFADLDRPVRIVEIGSWLGFSALTWAEAASKLPHGGSVLCVDSWAPYHTREDARDLDFPRRMDAALRADVPYQVFLHNVGQGPEGVTIDHIRGPSRSVLPMLRDDWFDLVYVDGSHYHEDVLVDLRQALRVVRDGGVVCGDDLERQIGDDEPERGIVGISRDEVNSHLGTDTHEFPPDGWYHPGVSLAVDEVLGRVRSWDGYWALSKEGQGTADLELASVDLAVPAHFPPAHARRLAAYESRLPPASRTSNGLGSTSTGATELRA